MFFSDIFCFCRWIFFGAPAIKPEFFSLIFVLIFIGVLAAISKQSWKTGYGIKFPKKWNIMWQDNPTICRLYRYRFFFVAYFSEAHTRMTSNHMPREHKRNLMGYHVTAYPVNLHFDVAKARHKIPVRHSVFQQIGKGMRRTSTGYLKKNRETPPSININ